MTDSAPVGSADVSDACDELGVEAVRTGSLRPLWPERPPLVGRVRTVRLHEAADTALPELLEVLAGAADQLLLVDLGGRLDLQCWGAVLATAAASFGVRGALINGAARDLEGLRDLGFATYARGVYPARIRGRLGLAGVDQSVELDGGMVDSSTFAIADASGVVFLPGSRAVDVLALASDLRTEEEQRLQAVREGGDPRLVFAPRPETPRNE